MSQKKTKKNLNFIDMATLKRFKTFRSLKQSITTKSKKPVVATTLRVAEVENFLLLLQKKKPKKIKKAKI